VISSKYKGEKDPLPGWPKADRQRAALLCFDEFHVSDIADAMILRRLLDGLFANGCHLGDDLQLSARPALPERPAAREFFLPTIALLNSHLDVLEVEAGVDYRLRTLEQVEIYHYPADAAAEKKMRDYFKHGGRAGTARRAGSRSAWPDIDRCGAATASSGSTSRHCVAGRVRRTITSKSPVLPHGPALAHSQNDGQQASEARRFTWLIDIFYDHKVKLISPLPIAPRSCCTPKARRPVNSARTGQPLTEMHSREYLGLPHLS
jgi:cell division protein ZapE